MGDRYLYYQSGVVEEIFSNNKAFISFKVNGITQRVLLWVKAFKYEGVVLDNIDSFRHKLSDGDLVTFHCHVYDKDENHDNCQWFAASAWLSNEGEFEQVTVTSRQGRITELETGRGVLQFEFFNKMESVQFIRSRYYNFGTRVSSKQALANYLTEDDMVTFDATRTQPSADCQWFGMAVWKGKRPSNLANSVVVCNPVGSHQSQNLVMEDDQPPQHLYSKFETRLEVRDGPGKVVSLIDEESGVALWMPAPNRWETVFFHRSIAFIDEVPIDKYDIKESYPLDTLLQITAVPSVGEFPCYWIARKVVATS